MQVTDFINSHHEAILSEWESFARTLLPGAEGLSKAALRDHAHEILSAIVHDMESRQSADEEAAKGKGEKTAGHLGALGQLHAVLRIESGFTLAQVVAEYRALRASVLRLWGKSHSDPEGVLRFNEAIDEALSEAVTRYAQKTNQYRDQVTGIVSHDLRTPLSAILMASTALLHVEGLDDKTAKAATRIRDSAKRMDRIVGDLLDLTRIRLGSGLPIVRRPTDVGPICRMVFAELERSHPNAVIQYTSHGDLRGEWDSDRLAQVLSNLVGNALQYGDPNKPISVVAKDDGEDVVVAVHNEGPPIPAGAWGDIFEPMVRHPHDTEKTATGLGLGLHITKQLVIAHGGQIEAKSTVADGTTFTVRLPRRAGST